jgi:O-antigen ligase
MATGVPAVRGTRAVDGAGLILLAGSLAWTAWTALAHGGHPLPVLGLQAGCAAAYGAARLATRWQRPVVPVAVVAVVASALVIQSVVPSVEAVTPPLGYVNANAALYVLTAVAAAMVADAFPPGPAGAVAVPLAIAFALAAVVSGSVTGMVVLALAAVVLVARLARAPLLLFGGCGLVLLVVVAVTAGLGVARLDEDARPATGRAGDVLDERRLLLWRDAAVIARRHPVDGAGPGRFQVLSPSARADADARWAHSGFLQQGAEAGAVGLALILATFGWGLVRLWWAGPGRPTTTLGVLALTALGLHAAVDYVLHFPAVPLVAAALVGAATVPARPHLEASTSR